VTVKIGSQMEGNRWKNRLKTFFQYVFVIGLWVNVIIFPTWVLDGYVSLKEEEHSLFGGERILLHGLGEVAWFSFFGALVTGSVCFAALKKYKDPVEIIKNGAPSGNPILAEGEHFVRGTLLTDGPTPEHIGIIVQQAKGEGQRALIKAKKGDRPMPPVLVAGVPYPYKFENLGMYIQGSTGAGKSQVIKQMIYDIRRRQGRDRLIIYDRKPEYLPIFYRKGDIVICPADRRHTEWDLFAEIKGEQDMDMITQSLIPEAIGNANDKFWTDSARNVFRGILVYLFNSAKKRGRDKVHNEDLCKFLFNYASAPDKMWAVLSQDKAAAAFAQPIAGAGKTQSSLPTSVMATMTSYTQSFTRPEVADRGSFSVRDWLHDPATEGGALFLLNPARYATNYQSYFTVILDILMRETISLPSDNDRRIWFFIDEFGSLFRLDSIKRLLAEGRSKGACIVIGTQDQSQIKDQYKEEGTQTIINNCNSKVLGRVSSAPEAEGLSKIIGEMEIERETESISSSYDNSGAKFSINDRTNESRRERRSVILPSELMNLPGLSYYLKFGDMNWMRSSIPYYPWNEHEIFPAFIPKPSSCFDTYRLIEQS